MYLILAQGSWRKAHGVFVSLTAHGARHTAYGTRHTAPGVFVLAAAGFKRFNQLNSY
jgi:hypothetical protein